ncbi:MAG TPA: hypothetical protein VIM53_04835 [Candidatus Saccharimonadales bacterium]
MRTFAFPSVEQTLAVLQGHVDNGMALYPSTIPRELVVPLRPRDGTLHDPRTGEPLGESVVAATDDQQYAIFKAAYEKPLTAAKSAPNYEPGTLGVSVTWRDLDLEHPTFNGFQYGMTDAAKALIAERTESGEVSWVGYFPNDGLERRDGVPDLASRKMVHPLGWIAVSADHFQGVVGPYEPRVPQQHT